MTKHRFYIASSLEAGLTTTLSGQEAAHLKNVLRLKEEERITLFNGKDIEALAQITEISRREVTVCIESVKPTSRESHLRIHLYQGLSKGERMDTVVQKAVELGVSELTPIITEHTAFTLDKKRLEKKMSHWQKIIENACCQSLRNQLMILNAPIPFRDAMTTSKTELSFILHTTTDSSSLPDKATNTISLWVGPEGGFSEAEIEFAKNHQTQPLQLGPRVLRTETAAITACSLMQWQYGDFIAS